MLAAAPCRAAVAVQECGEAMDVGAATKIGAQREGENLRLIVETPTCPKLKILGVWKALELNQGSRQLTGKIRGLSGPYEPGEKAIIGRNLSESNPFLEPGDLASLKQELSLRGTIAMEYIWEKSAPLKVKSKTKKRTAKKAVVKSLDQEPQAPAKVRINIPVSVQVQASS